MKFIVVPEGWEPMEIETRGGSLVGCRVADNREDRIYVSADRMEEDGHDPAYEVSCQLIEYFTGKLKTFSLPLAPEGTPFQKEVWKALLNIPYGEVISYGELARIIGQPGACRAVARACGANPIGVIIPCHRVVASNGGIGGYNGGIERKKRLLDLESGSSGVFGQPYK